MNMQLRGCGGIAALALFVMPTAGLADGDPYEGCTRTFADPSYGSGQFRESCESELRRRRAELAAWGIEAGGMSGVDAWDRHGAELRAREQAREDQARRDAMERERLAAERAEADAERERIAAEREREAQQYAAAQMQAGQQMMQQQSETMQGLGVNLGNPSRRHEDCKADDYSAYELNMYQSMIDNGVAADCNGLSCGELVDCVDAYLDEQDE